LKIFKDNINDLENSIDEIENLEEYESNNEEEDDKEM
jgi:hypothetical protein